MKTKTFKRILCCMLALLILAGSIHWLSDVFSNKNSQEHFNMFYEQDENFDVLFTGSSHMLNAIIPMQLWEEQGIVSYNMAFGSCHMSQIYWLIKNAFLYTDPKLIVLDCAYLYYDEKTSESSGPNHMLFNTMPLSTTKLEAAWDLYDNRSDRLRYLFPLTEFHRRWNELSYEDFRVSEKLMGQDLHFTVESATVNCAPRDDTVSRDSVGFDYLRMIIEECQSRDVDVLLTYIPFEAGEESMKDMASIYKLADEYSLNYIDPYAMLEFLQLDTDYFNSYEDNSHLNFSGAAKFTSFIGQYICENYDIADHREDPDYFGWTLHYKSYLDELSSVISNAQSADEILTVLCSNEFDAYIEVLDSSVLDNSTIRALLENLGVETVRLEEESRLVLRADHTLIYGGEAPYQGTEDAFSTDVNDGKLLFYITLGENEPIIKII